MLLGLSAAACSSGSDPLPDEFVATAVSVDAEARDVTWRVSCGSGKGETHTVSVNDAEFSYETKPEEPSSGHVESVSFAEWQALAAGQPWVVTTVDGVVRSVSSFSAPGNHDPCA
jgi:hypothetical protein